MLRYHSYIVPQTSTMYLIRTENFAKLFFAVSFTGLLIYIILAFYTIRLALENFTQTRRLQKKIQSLPDPGFPPHINAENEKPKYILLWSPYDDLSQMPEGRQPFKDYDCLHQNCYITVDKKIMDIESFDAIVFNVSRIRKWIKTDFPTRRSPLQKYIFFGKESSYDAPICSTSSDGFFNWTWSYKLYSDILSPFIEVRDLKGNILAPNVDVIWNSSIYHHTPLVQIQPWKTKKKAVACILKKCGTGGKEILRELKRIQYIFRREKMAFDLFGCKIRDCKENSCLEIIKEQYYFYFIHEGGPTEDWITDDVVNAIEAGIVPIIFSGADLDKFLPPNSYINAKSITSESLVALVYYAIKNPTVYQGFFRWKNYYTIHRTPMFQGICQLCKLLNNNMMMHRNSHYEYFRRWWYEGPLDERCLKFSKASVIDALSYLNESKVF